MRTFAIIPAAGRSIRMGQPKLLLPLGDSTVIGQVLSNWKKSRVGHVVVVVHPLDRELADLARRAGGEVVQPALAPPEMKDSVRVALDYVKQTHQPAPTDAWLMAPADMPSIEAATIDRLIQAYADGVEQGRAEPIYVPTGAGKRGHPVLFAWSLADEVARLADDEGLNALATRHPVATVEDPLTALDDMDTPQEYEAARRKRGG